MEFISGSKEYFFDFLDNLKKTDRIAVLSHTDLDGIASAIILKEILKNKKIKEKYLGFIDYGKGVFEKLIPKLKNKRINKILISDISIDSDYEGYKKLKEKFKIFVVDHHPFENEDIESMIKTKSEDCATFALFQLTKEYLSKEKTNLDYLNELICATMISEFSYTKKENLEFIQNIYPKSKLDNISNSLPGMLSKKISSTIIYFKDKKKKVFSLVYKKDYKKFEKYYKIIDKQINDYVEKYPENNIILKKNINFYYIRPSPKFNITSIITTILSLKSPEETFICCSNNKEEPLFVKVNARCQSGNQDVNLLMKKGIEGLEQASGGGHVKAAAARFLEKDLEKFKQNLIT